MNELIKVNYIESEQPTVSGRELHEALEVKTPYTQWFDRMAEYGFTENVDFSTVHKNVIRSDGSVMPQTQYDHQLTIDMAKEICMIQRSEKGKQFRQYFIEIENRWNTPEAVMARALQMANRKLEEIKNTNKQLSETVAIQTQQIAELQPKASYYDVVLNCKDLVAISVIAKDYGKSPQWLNNYLHGKGIQFKQGNIWLLYAKYCDKGYTGTKTQTYPGNDGEIHSKPSTYWTQEGRRFIYGLLKGDGIVPLIERKS